METVTEKAPCAKCGADVREGTAFCYACGAAVAEPAVDLNITRPANGSEPTAEESAEDKLSKAREERRKARVGQKKPVEYTWAPVDDARWTVLAALVVTVAVAVLVAAMVYWK